MDTIDRIMSGEIGLLDAEEYMRGIETDIKTGMTHLAITLGAIKLYRLFLDVAKSFPEYIEKERTYLKKSTAYSLAAAGENYLRYQKDLEKNQIQLSNNKEKIKIIDHYLAAHDPMFFVRLKEMSYRRFREYQEEKKGVYIDVYNSENDGVPVAVKGTGLYIGDKKLKGLNITEAKEKLSAGKRAFIVWIDDNEAARKRAKRAIEKTGIGEDRKKQGRESIITREENQG